MPKTGPIVLIDDDNEDLEMFSEIISAYVPNEVISFDNSTDAFKFLFNKAGGCFLIICDINMPVMNGLELRSKIFADKSLKEKTVPFLFLSTSDRPEYVKEAYDLTAQGYFHKPASFDQMQKLFKAIIDYWAVSRSPDKELQ